MSIEIGQLKISEISGPTSIYFLSPEETSTIDVPILFIGDCHFSFDGMCNNPPGPIVDTNRRNNLLSVSAIDPLFFKILDTLGSNNGFIDYYIEYFSKPTWMQDMKIASLSEQHNHSVITYLPAKHFACFEKESSVELCFTKHIRYHFVDVRNADFTYNFTPVTSASRVKVKSEDEWNNLYKLDKEDKKYYMKDMDSLEETNRTFIQSQRPQYHPNVQDLISTLKMTRRVMSKEEIERFSVEYITYETALHRMLDKIVPDLTVENDTHTFFGYSVKYLALLALVAPLDFIDLIFDFNDMYVQQYSLIYKQIRKIQCTNDKENYYNPTSQVEHKYFILEFCAFQYNFHLFLQQATIHELISSLQSGITYPVNMYAVTSPGNMDAFFEHQKVLMESTKKRLKDSYLSIIRAIMCPILDVYFYFRSMKMYGFDEEDTHFNKPSILKIFHAGDHHVRNIVAFLKYKGFYKEVFTSSFDNDSNNQSLMTYKNAHRNLNKPYKEEGKYPEILNPYVPLSVKLKPKKTQKLVDVFENPDEVRLLFDEYEKYMQFSMQPNMSFPSPSFYISRCRTFASCNPEVHSIDKYIKTMLSGKGLIRKRLEVFGEDRYIGILSGKIALTPLQLHSLVITKYGGKKDINQLKRELDLERI